MCLESVLHIKATLAANIDKLIKKQLLIKTLCFYFCWFLFFLFFSLHTAPYPNSTLPGPEELKAFIVGKKIGTEAQWGETTLVDIKTCYNASELQTVW